MRKLTVGVRQLEARERLQLRRLDDIDSDELSDRRCATLFSCKNKNKNINYDDLTNVLFSGVLCY